VARRSGARKDSLGPRRSLTARSLGDPCEIAHQFLTGLMILPCHEGPPLSSPAWQSCRAGRQMRRFELFFDCASACTARSCSASAAAATADNAIAVRPAAPSLYGNNAARRTAAINRRMPVVKTIATVSEFTGNDVRRGAGLRLASWCKPQDSTCTRRMVRRVRARQSHPA
jgi:hypothetical protein